MFGLALIFLLQVQSASIEGIVNKPGGGEPLAGARVFLTPAGSNNSVPFNPLAPIENQQSLGEALAGANSPNSSRPFLTISEDDGRFSLRDVPPGTYTLTAQTARYGSALYGQRRSGGPGSTLTVNAGQRLVDIKISMVPTGAIAGRVTGRNGDPVVRAFVQAYQLSYRDGKRILAAKQSAIANDLGEYRLFSLPAGQYFVAATLEDDRIYGAGVMHIEGETAHIQRMMTFDETFASGRVINRLRDDGTIQEEMWMPTYYPGSTLGDQATPVSVAAGATMNGINISISPSPVLKIRGQVVGPPGSSPEVTIIPPNSYLGFKTLSVNLEPRGGSFEFKGVVPGLYTLLAKDQRTGLASAPVEIEVGDRDVDNLTIGLTPGITLAGRMVLEGGLDERGAANLLATVSLELRERHPDVPRLAQRTGNGTFVLNNLGAGEYQAAVRYLDVTGRGFDAPELPRDAKPLFVKSVRLGQSDVTDGIPITANTRDSLEIVLTTETGSLEGIVTDSRRMPAAGATVVLVPAVARRNSARYAAVVSDSAGQFRLQGIVPGDYLLFAWDDVETGAWQSPEFLRPYESSGRPVKVTGTGKQDVQILAISNP